MDQTAVPDPVSAGGQASEAHQRTVGGAAATAGKGALSLSLGIAIIVAWEVLVRILQVPIYILPAPSTVAGSLARNLVSLTPDTGVTTFEALLGLVLAVAVSVPLAAAIAFVPWLSRVVSPVIVASQAVPKIALAPLFIVWFGFGVSSKVFLAFLICFFPLVIDTVAGFKSVQPDYIALAQTMRANPLRIFRRVRAPYALPHFFAGLKVASSLAVIGAIVGEFIGSDRGLGFRMLTAFQYLDTPLLFAIIVLMSLIGIVFFYAVVLIERMAIPWHVSQRGKGND